VAVAGHGNWLKALNVLELVQQGLGPGYIAVRPDQLAMLYRQSKH
jgi:hypothetical protein